MKKIGIIINNSMIYRADKDSAISLSPGGFASLSDEAIAGSSKKAESLLVSTCRTGAGFVSLVDLALDISRRRLGVSLTF